MTTNPAQTILDWAKTTPDVPAIESASFTMTYGELADSVRRMAAKLRGLGIRPGSVVAIRTRPELEAVLTIALLHEGAASLHGSEAVLAAYGSQIDFLLGEPARASRTTATVIEVDADFMLSLGAVNPDIEPRPLDQAHGCRIVFSSGTTGSPKGVEFTVATLHTRTASARTNWIPLDPFMCLLGLDTVSGFQTFIWSVMHGRTYLLPGDGPTNLGLLAAHGVRSLKTSPARLENLLDALEADESQRGRVQLEVVEVAGSLLSPTLAARCEALLAFLPTYLYGSTEVGTVTRGEFDPARPNMVGSVVADAELQIVAENGDEVTGSVTRGLVRYRTAHTPDHYWRATPEANLSFRHGWFYPGDLGAITADGEMLISGRADDLVNAGGAKFNLAELDLWMGELELFVDCASFTFTDATGAAAIGIAFQSRHEVQPAIVLERVRGLLPNLEIRAIVRMDTIPRNQLGKVDRLVLRASIGEQS